MGGGGGSWDRGVDVPDAGALGGTPSRVSDTRRDGSDGRRRRVRGRRKSYCDLHPGLLLDGLTRRRFLKMVFMLGFLQ